MRTRTSSPLTFRPPMQEARCLTGKPQKGVAGIAAPRRGCAQENAARSPGLQHRLLCRIRSGSDRHRDPVPVHSTRRRGRGRVARCLEGNGSSISSGPMGAIGDLPASSTPSLREAWSLLTAQSQTRSSTRVGSCTALCRELQSIFPSWSLVPGPTKEKFVTLTPGRYCVSGSQAEPPTVPYRSLR
ncbi:hypothetical protein LZ30DRAFT_321425 [Colletotrichum cereale]|nr:hypothetical protein LZ30DRAFT_321425 [Colletotrichum cereale]